MKIISWNVNGLRSVIRKGFLDWVKREDPDVLCLQEIKIQEREIPFDLRIFNNYNSVFNSSRKKGYAGVAVYAKDKPTLISKCLKLERFDDEGRFLQIKLPEFDLINVYLPHGGRDKHDLNYKLKVYQQFLKYLGQIKDAKIILTGDFNIAHEDIDLARPNENKENLMFTPAERLQIDNLINLGYIDTFRYFYQDGGNYSWWSYMRKSRERNLGWRIDYTFASSKLTPKLADAFILKDISLGSDHSPVGVVI